MSSSGEHERTLPIFVVFSFVVFSLLSSCDDDIDTSAREYELDSSREELLEELLHVTQIS